MRPQSDNSIGTVLKEYVRLTLLGWWSVVRTVARELESYGGGIWQRHVYLTSGLAMILLVIPGWVEYELTFLQKAETYTIPTNSRFVFALAGLISILLYIFEMPAALILGRVATVLALAVYIAGFLFPAPLHTYLQGDYSFTLWAYSMIFPLLINLLVMKEAIRLPLIRFGAIRQFLKSDSDE
ncbi:MAG: hypothetical protein HS115_00305 [Spirochaetales bacterium]|nr:hypothetical protein [Spirochaetales bacterium]